jgi:hypothetical protein
MKEIVAEHWVILYGGLMWFIGYITGHRNGKKDGDHHEG